MGTVDTGEVTPSLKGGNYILTLALGCHVRMQVQCFQIPEEARNPNFSVKYPHFYLFIIFLQLRVLFSQQRIVHSRREGRPTPKESHFLFYILKVANQILNFGQQHEPNKTYQCVTLMYIV